MLSDATPTIFPNLPKYFNKANPERRSQKSSFQSRFQKEYEATESASQSFLDADKISDFNDLKQKITEETLPVSVLKLFKDDKITFYTLDENDLGCPYIKFSLIVNEDLSFSMWCREVKVQNSKVKHICDTKLTSISAVSNIIAVLKNLYDEKTTIAKLSVEYCASILEEIIPGKFL